MQHFDFNVGDTNFICLVNAHKYASFVDEDWDLVTNLIPHVVSEKQKGTILMYQMTQEGIEDDWKISITQSPLTFEKYIKKSINYISVTDHSLYLIDYTNLTMAAQFDDEKIPDKSCAPFRIELDNGKYTVTAYLFKDVDNDIVVNEESDLLFVFEPYTAALSSENQTIIWGSF